MITIGYNEAGMRRLFAEVTQIGTVQSVDGVRNEEVGRPILICRRPIVQLDEAWRALRSLS